MRAQRLIKERAEREEDQRKEQSGVCAGGSRGEGQMLQRGQGWGEEGQVLLDQPLGSPFGCRVLGRGGGRQEGHPQRVGQVSSGIQF